MNAEWTLLTITALASWALLPALAAWTTSIPGSQFTGHWTATDPDGSTLTMRVGQGEAPCVQFRDSKSDCAGDGTSNRLTGLGSGEYFEV